MTLPFSNMEPWVITTYIITLCLYLVTGVSQAQCAFYLAALSLHSSASVEDNRGLCSQVPVIPTTVETLIIRAKIEPKYKSHVCCPRCFRLYDPTKHDPASCDFKEDPGGDACGEQLRKKDGKPVREFVAHDFKDWLARLYARPGVEELLNRDVLRPSTPGKMADIWDAPVLWEFMGPDGRNFMRDKGTDCRLIFSINMDGFNPYGNKQSGKQVSVSAIYMTCLNLPHDIWNRMENIFLFGVIPSPKELSLTQINHLLELLVDVLLELWDVGVYF